DIERAAGTRIEGHHLFPTNWAQKHAPSLLGDIDRVANIAVLTAYTNGWIKDKAPEEYTDRLVSLGMARSRLDLILKDHLVDPDNFRSDSWTNFYEDRRANIHDLVAEVLAGPV